MSIDLILEALEQIQEKLDRLLAKGTIIKEEISGEEWTEKLEKATNSKLPEVRIHSPGFEDYKPEEGISLDIEYQGRRYKGKWSPCKYKCGGLTSWPEDYKKGDQKLHVHPTDKEILGFAQEDMNGNLKCPMVVKK